MERSVFDCKDFTGVHWHDADNQMVLIAQTDKRDGRSLVNVGNPFICYKLTRDESIAIVDRFGPTVAVLLSDMRAELAKMRGGK